MNKFISQILIGLFAAAVTKGQGFIYDQQSADENHYMEGGVGLGQQPLGQSFTPSLSAIGFIRTYLFGGSSGTFIINLRSNSITGPILASSDPVSLTATGPVNFFFANPIVVTANSTYYFQPLIQNAVGGWGVFAAQYNYANGTAFVDGFAVPNSDFWFREGIVVPEPQSWALLLVGFGLFFYARLRSLKM